MTRSFVNIMQTCKAPHPFAVGVRVTVCSGVFANLTGTIKRLEPHHALVRLDAASVRVQLSELRRTA